MVSLAVGYDAAKQIKGRKRHLSVDTLGLVLRVLVTAANMPEREGGKQVLALAGQMGDAVSRLHTIWVDGGYDGDPFLRWVMDTCRAHCTGSAATPTTQGICLAPKALGRRAYFRMVELVPTAQQRV